MPIKAIVDKLDDVEEPFRGLYTPRGDKFEITGIEGMRTQADVDRIQSGLKKERDDHKALRDRWAPLSTREPADIQAMLDRYPELEEAAKGKLDDAKIDEIVGKRIVSKLAPVERERDTFKTQLAERDQIIQGYEAKERHRTISDKVREAGALAKVLPEAMEDALLLAERVFEISEDGRVVTKDNVGVTPGIDAAVWLTEMQTKRPHWWGPSSGGGGRGSNGNTNGNANPWSAEHWNLTEQGKILVANPTKAEQMAKSAGTSIGGRKPDSKK